MHVFSLSFQLQSCTPDLLLRGWLWTDRSCFSSDTIPQVHTRPVYRLFIGLWNCNIKMFLIWHGSQIWSRSLLRNYFVCWPDQQTLSQRSEEIRPAVHTDTHTQMNIFNSCLGLRVLYALSFSSVVLPSFWLCLYYLYILEEHFIRFYTWFIICLKQIFLTKCVQLKCWDNF